MKHNKRIFNHLLYTYNKSKRKLAKLRSENRNVRRQGIMERRIERLFARLSQLWNSIQKASIAGAIAAAAFAFTGNEAKAQFPIFDTKQVNPFNLSGYTYNNPKPEFVDLDGDGDYDVVAMIGSYYGPNQFQYFENTGTNTSPSYAAPVTNPFGLSNYHIAPPIYMYYDNFSFDFVDLDNDGDFDVVAKRRNSSTFYYFENTGNTTSAAFGVPTVMSVYYNNSREDHPHFADLDGDGDLDMITGLSDYYYGNVLVYRENTGSNSAPDFSTSFAINPFGIGTVAYRSTPEFVDIDADGDFDILTGAQYYSTGFVFFENTGTNLAPAFGSPQTLPFGLTTGYYDSRTNPTMVDLDGDGNVDLLSGNNYGQFIYYKNLGICNPTSSTISPSAACAYTSPLGNIYTSSANFTETIMNAAGCDSVITINLTISPLTDVTPGASPTSVCFGSNGSVLLPTSQNGVNYYLRDDSNNAIVDGPIVGDGNGISFNTGILTTATTFNVYADGNAPANALEFDGVDDKVDCGNDPSIQLSGNAITLEAWIYPTAWANNIWEGNIICKETGGPDRGYMLRCGNNGSLNFNLGNGGWNEITTPQNTLTLNTWQHVAGVYDGVDMKLYVDGNLVLSQAMSNLNFFSSGNNLAIGNWSPNNGRPFSGKIDDVRIWSAVKTQTDIQTDMNNCLTGMEANLAALYKFNQASGSSILSDATGNGNTGTLLNMDNNNAWVAGTPGCVACDLEMTTTVTVNVTTVDVTTTNTAPTLSANANGAAYQWVDCNNGNAFIPSETGQSYIATNNGSYAVIVTQNGCSDTSACMLVNNVGISENGLDRISVYPNPTNGMVNVAGLNGQYSYEISSMDGRVIASQRNANNAIITVDLSQESKGVYFMRIIADKDSKFIKIVKQ